MDPYQVTERVLESLHRLKAEVVVGGSLASSLYGEARFTQDADLLARLDRCQAADLIQELESEFYVSSDAALDAVRRRASFNLIHFASQYKVDIFVSPEREFEKSRFQRKRRPEGFSEVWAFSSPEDVVLAKLEWFRQGGEVADRQWRDVLAVLAVQGAALDQYYLCHWAQQLGVEDLLQQALQTVRPLL